MLKNCPYNMLLLHLLAYSLNIVVAIRNELCYILSTNFMISNNTSILITSTIASQYIIFKIILPSNFLLKNHPIIKISLCLVLEQTLQIVGNQGFKNVLNKYFILDNYKLLYYNNQVQPKTHIYLKY